MQSNMMIAIHDGIPERLARRLGPAVVLIEEGSALATGGALVRALCQLDDGDDIDLLTVPASTARVHDLLTACGYITDDATMASVSRTQRPDEPVCARAKFFPPAPLAHRWSAVDVLTLAPTLAPNQPADLTADAFAFIATFDGAIFRQLLGRYVVGHQHVGWGATREAMAAYHRYVVGWEDVTVTSEGRRAKWDALLPGVA